MAEERRRRRRGHRRGRGRHPTDRRPEERPGEQPEIEEESEAPGILPPRLRFRFGRRGGADKREKERQRREREEAPTGSAPADVSPLSFWRRGRARTYREQPMPKRTIGRTMRRIQGMYFPPWVPVLFIIVLVSGILVFLFIGPLASAGAPRMNQDHWHAPYQVFICGKRQPNFPTWSGGVHTHADGVIHIHPHTPPEEGAGARLVKWFEYGGGKLTQTEMRMPGTREEYKNGDTCPDGSQALLQVFVNGEKVTDWSRYVPQDGDRIRIVFGPEEAAPTELGDRTVIPESQATRTVELEVTDTGPEASTAFAPASIELLPGETIKLAVRNTGTISHIVRVAGADGEYNTSDDFVSDPETILPGEEGVLVVRFEDEGEYEFQDPSVATATGKLVVSGEPVAEGPTAEPDTATPVDVTFDVVMGDNFFQPNRLEVRAGQTFRINLTNDGEFVHNLRIAGPDKAYDTGDDLASTPDVQRSGDTGELVGEVDEPGVYNFRCDFHPVDMTGTLTVR